jgi:hypothetical protein
MNKLVLWDAVCKTDPNYVKKVQQRGGFTAINAQYQMRNATEQFGAYGDGWGMKDLNYNYVYNVEGTPVEITLDAMFWYKMEADHYAEFPISGDALYKPGQDLRKKLLTDVTTKALSKLGFNADVFLGLYDNPEYMRTLHEENKQPEPQKEPEKLTNDKLKAMLEAIGNGHKDVVVERLSNYNLTKVQQGKIDKAILAVEKLGGDE